MGTQILFLVFGVIVQFCNVSGRNKFYEYYYSRYHKGHSTTTESIFPSTSDILDSSEYERESSSPDYISWEKTNDMISTTDDNSLENNKFEVTDDTSLKNNMYEPTVYTFEEIYSTNYSALTIGLISAGGFILLSVFCCFCFIRICCPRKERRGFVIAGQPETAREVLPQQNAQFHQPPESQQPYPTQCYEERSQFIPPQYHPQAMHQFPPMQQQSPPMQPQFQYSPPGMQYHNPPEAPPPYEFPHKS